MYLSRSFSILSSNDINSASSERPGNSYIMEFEVSGLTSFGDRFCGYVTLRSSLIFPGKTYTCEFVLAGLISFGDRFSGRLNSGSSEILPGKSYMIEFELYGRASFGDRRS